LKHDPLSYIRFRPDYPAAWFDKIKASLSAKKDPLILDLGAGTGLSILSMLRAGVPGGYIGVEPDSDMLERAQETIHEKAPEFENRIAWKLAPAEKTTLPSGCASAIIIASAYHWMQRPSVDDEIIRLAAPGACVQIFEYQFPKAHHQPGLNEWIRRQFNTVWRFDEQKPRGSLRELCQGLTSHPRVLEVFNLASTPELSMMHRELSVDELLGLIFSQARAIRHLTRLESQTAREQHRQWTRQHLLDFFRQADAERIMFDFKLTGLFLKLC
jgi:ubiquinone/menaquinone biosynthesis C-methylase UbiE